MARFPLRPYQSLALFAAMSSMQVGKTHAQEMAAKTLEEDGWLRSKTEGQEMWVRNDASKIARHHPSDFQLAVMQAVKESSHKPFKLPDASPMTLAQFCKKHYPLPEVTPEMISYTIGNGLREKDMFTNMFTCIDALAARERRHNELYMEIGQELKIGKRT